MRRILLLLLLLSPVAAYATPLTTPAERLADTAAQHELETSPPDGNLPSYSLPPEALRKSVRLEHIRTTLHFTDEVWGTLQLVLLLAAGAVAWFQRVARRFGNRWLQGYTFVLLLTGATTLLSLPVAIYAQHLRRVYGLSVQAWPGWAWDQTKGFLLAWVFGGLLTMLLFLILRKAPRRWWLVLWVAMVPITIGAMFAEPYIIEPMFNTFAPLSRSNPEFVARLEEVAQRGHMNIPPERMFLMKASEKVTTLNAYVSGFGASKRVVVWDTSLAKGTPDEILFIFGHESGHYVLHHIVRGMLLTFAGGFVLLYLAQCAVRWLLRRYGNAWGVHTETDWGTLAVLLLVFSVFGAVLEPATSTLSRMQEHAADVYGQEAIHGIVRDPQATARAAFQVLGETSYDDPNPSRMIEFWTYSHPSIGRRAAFAAHYDPWAAGMQPKYFSPQR